VTAGAVTRSVLYLVGFVALAVVLGRPLIARVMQVAAHSGNTMTSIVFAVVLVILGGALTQSLGMEAIFGAFVVGILIGLPGAADQGHLAPLRTIVLAVLAPLFMATAGLRMDLTALLEPSIALAAVVVLAIAIIGKFVGAYIGAKLARIGHWEAVALGAGMNARGVVEVIVALTGLRLGVLTAATYTIVVVVAIVTSLMAPPLLRWAVGHLDQNDDETLRRATHDSWAGAVAVAVAEK
jgi:Kef-type K+ transport system membrane component KefB